MTNKWEQAENLAEQHANQGSIFVRLSNHGDKVVGVFCGEPHTREVHWIGDKYVECSGDGCPYCSEGKRSSLRVMLNFFVPAESEMKIIEGGTTWFKSVIKVREKYGLVDRMFEIERHGDSGDPKTTYSVLPDEMISASLHEKMASYALHDLVKVSRGDNDDADTPIDDETAQQFVTRLKALPRSEVDSFLEQFHVKRVRDIGVSEVDAARKLLSGLETYARRKAESAQTDVDPFA